jgi:hypothetical protein
MQGAAGRPIFLKAIIARFLRHNGILLVVGATATSEKYRHIYDTISDIIVRRGYGNHRFAAWCKPVKVEPNVLSYQWNDGYGDRLKKHLRSVYGLLQEQCPEDIPDEAARILNESIVPAYNRTNAWQVLVFRKIARPHPQKRRKNTRRR